MNKEVMTIKCENCKEDINYTDSDIKSNYITSASDVLDGFDFYSKWVVCPHCGKENNI